MSQTGCRRKSPPAARGARGSRPPAVRSLLALLALLQLAPAPAVPPAPARPPRSGDALKRDYLAGYHGKQALLSDRQLKDLQLMVRVYNGVAVVSGNAPTAELARKAVKKLEKVRGIYSVKNEIVIRPRPVEPLPLTFRPDRPTKTQSASPNPLSEAAGAPTDRAPAPPPAPPPSPTVSLRGPVPVAKPPREAPGLPVSVRPTPAPSLAAEVDRVRRGDDRFRPILAEVRGKTVLLHAGGARPEHVAAFARALSLLTGVEDVVIQSSDGR